MAPLDATLPPPQPTAADLGSTIGSLIMALFPMLGLGLAHLLLEPARLAPE